MQCENCGAWLPLDGPRGFLPHLLGQHPESRMGQTVLRWLVTLPLPPWPVRYESREGAA
jgi:hypothetical protein